MSDSFVKKTMGVLLASQSDIPLDMLNNEEEVLHIIAAMTPAIS
jgi:hypothetical protein